MQLFLFNVNLFLFPHLSVTMGLCSMCLWSFFWGNKGENSTSFSKWVSEFLAAFLIGLQLVLEMFPFPAWGFLKLLLFLLAPSPTLLILISTCSDFRFILNPSCRAQRFNYWGASTVPQPLQHSWPTNLLLHSTFKWCWSYRKMWGNQRKTKNCHPWMSPNSALWLF